MPIQELRVYLLTFMSLDISVVTCLNHVSSVNLLIKEIQNVLIHEIRYLKPISHNTQISVNRPDWEESSDYNNSIASGPNLSQLYKIVFLSTCCWKDGTGVYLLQPSSYSGIFSLDLMSMESSRKLNMDYSPHPTLTIPNLLVNKSGHSKLCKIQQWYRKLTCCFLS